ncbi:Sigma-70, region 4 [Pollutimonas bauzanensis]|uniref:Sigma-70, region 4 n=2 Tax=Pollutimonas bauzanensis TaxID=658167 RepID=A0A1M5W2B0_9BURK|nr:Sigma-70, region 4 [Pollutimonas bauzanensis]
MLQTLDMVTPDEAPSVEREVGARQQLDCLMARLAAMPRKRREAFILVRIYGCSHAEAAEHLNSTKMAIEKHIVRGVIDCMNLASDHA